MPCSNSDYFCMLWGKKIKETEGGGREEKGRISLQAYTAKEVHQQQKFSGRERVKRSDIGAMHHVLAAVLS